MTVTRPILIGIAGGSGSGKTYLARYIQREVGEEHVTILSMDQYFRSLSPEERTLPPHDINFDHPSRLDLELLQTHLERLREGQTIMAPCYDFRSQLQTPEAVTVTPKPVILVEGLFILLPIFADTFDLTVFLRVDPDQRLIGRLLRDIQEREQSVAWNIDRYQRFVRPSYQRFVEPTMQLADLVVDFTYRRVFFQQILTNVVHDAIHNGFDLESLVRSVRGDGYRLGLIDGAEPQVPLAETARDAQPTLWAADNPEPAESAGRAYRSRGRLTLKSDGDPM